MSLEHKFLENTALYATQILQQELSDKLYYHNYEHTRFVVKYSEILGRQSNLSDTDQEIVNIAAWLHDLGYVQMNNGHEELSKTMAQNFLESQHYPSDKIQKVLECIESTKIPQKPQDILSEVLCDADMAHLAADDFFERCDPLRKEWEVNQGRVLTDYQWLKINEDFMLKHRFFTPYGKTILEEKKKANLKKVQKKLKKVKKKQDDFLTDSLGVSADQLRELEKKLKKVDGRSERGVETVFRITSRNHLDLSSMADSKANIMISVNTIIISVVISILLQQLDTRPHLILPTTCLLISCLTTIIFSVLATRPNITSGRFTREDVEKRETNLLFFGNFHKMKLEDYEWGIREMLDDSDYLYGSLIRDIYFLGIVLGKKYRLLRIAYTIFMFGLASSVLLFIFSVIFKDIFIMQ